MKNRKVRAMVKNSRTLFNSECNSPIVMGRLVVKLFTEKYDVMQWHMQAGNITTNFRIKFYFTLPALSATNGMT